MNLKPKRREFFRAIGISKRNCANSYSTSEIKDGYISRGEGLIASPKANLNCNSHYSTIPDHNMSSTKNTTELVSNSKPRVLIVVAGGVADFIADDGVDVAIFDWDDYKSAPDITSKPSKHFENLAIQCDIPVAVDQDLEMT